VYDGGARPGDDGADDGRETAEADVGDRERKYATGGYVFLESRARHEDEDDGKVGGKRC